MTSDKHIPKPWATCGETSSRTSQEQRDNAARLRSDMLPEQPAEQFQKKSDGEKTNIFRKATCSEMWRSPKKMKVSVTSCTLKKVQYSTAEHKIVHAPAGQGVLSSRLSVRQNTQKRRYLQQKSAKKKKKGRRYSHACEKQKQIGTHMPRRAPSLKGRSHSVHENIQRGVPSCRNDSRKRK